MPVRSGVEQRLALAPNGKSIDVYRPSSAPAALPTVLLWHGIGPDERDILMPLAWEVAALGTVVFAPDWRSDAADGGRADLLGSLEFVRARAAEHGGDADRIVLAGWSAGASAALGVALHPEVADGWRPRAVVGIASRYDRPARTTGHVPLVDLAAGPAATPVPVRLVHGTADEQIDVAYSRDLVAALEAHGWAARLDEVHADHAGAIMAAYDPELGRCRPSEDERVRRAGELTARAVAEAAGA
ncbi:alpha/beta hydrolase [Streptomyces netropsis]|uniref:Putative esterase n=1 Tax=Streptomyces netropsis TaxID=55404 RepID=A0A7W7LGV9_STRNE|nr:carboxylesterase family protein [Streptomyces netropsis]MBB4889451.1 putative esterase [Streptomyces netropsis]GGR40173.1 hypothetical protein GCM10010219_51800 [Streptomyces netropsis]